MILDYSKLEFDQYGQPEKPVLMLQTMDGRDIGALPSSISNLHFNIKFSEPSEMSFTIPSHCDGKPTNLYNEITGYKLIYTKNLGIYILMNPETTGEGIYEIKEVQGYSLEKALETKKFFLEEGTFNFWNPASPTDTIMGRLLEVASVWGWAPGYVSSSLIGRYRTFDSYDDYLLQFVYNTAPEKYRCVFSFDPYQRTINVYDADEERGTLPIYLDFENAINELEISELSDELYTAMRPYGADELDIRDVNPTGANWIYDLSYFISSGDIEPALAAKWTSWQRSVLNRREYYKGLVSLRSSTTAQLLAQNAVLVDLKGELDDLINQQSVTIQAMALEITDEGKANRQAQLDEINRQIAAKNSEISAQQNKISSIQQLISENYSAQIQAVNKELALDNYFTDDEYNSLSRYFIECDMTDETFVATDIDTNISGQSYNLTYGSISLLDSEITYIDMSAEFNRQMYSFSGGTFSVSGNSSLSGDIIRGTLETTNGSEFVLSIYAGSMSSGGASSPSGTVTLSGEYRNLGSDIHPVTVDEVTTHEGSYISLGLSSASMYVTANISDYQKYSVQMELYDFAAKVLSDSATPTYEFSVDSANILFAQKFAPFRDKLELGKGVYLKISDTLAITPILIEIEFDFEDYTEFSLIFSNRFKRHDEVNTLSDMIESSYSSSRSFDASKYIYNQTVGQTSAVSEFLSGSLDAAVNTILGASNQSVVINGAGIQIGGESNRQMRIVDSMIAITDDDWQTAKLAIGYFASPEIGQYYGVNAEVIGGKLIVGNNLVIENTNDDGVMQFKVDSTGAWLSNSTFVLQKDYGGKLLIDPKYGIVAGTSELFTTEGTTVTPSFINSSGGIITDNDGMPQNANFFLDLRDGNAYFRGKLNAESGSVGGWVIEDNYLYSGSGSTRVVLNASGSWNSTYAIWAGSNSPSTAPFYVTRDGSLRAYNGEFRGTIHGANFQDSFGNSMMDDEYKFKGQYLNLLGINVGNGNFVVDEFGNVTVKGNITMGTGSSINWAAVSETNATHSQAYQRANSAYNRADTAYNRATQAQESVSVFEGWRYGGGTYIDGTKIMADTIMASYLKGGKIVLLDAAENEAGEFTLQGASSYAGSKTTITSGAIEISGTDGDVYLEESAGAYIQISHNGIRGRITFGTSDICPNEDGIWSCGRSSARWSEVYAATGTIQTSDREKKKDIDYNLSKYDALFEMLKPASCKYIDGTSDRTHLVFVSQDIESALEPAGLTSLDFAGFVKAPRIDEEGQEIDGEYDYFLRYDEFIPMCVHQIQKANTEIVVLKQEISELKGAIK